jgi:hypothetical protein
VEVLSNQKNEPDSAGYFLTLASSFFKEDELCSFQ